MSYPALVFAYLHFSMGRLFNQALLGSMYLCPFICSLLTIQIWFEPVFVVCFKLFRVLLALPKQAH